MCCCSMNSQLFSHFCFLADSMNSHLTTIFRVNHANNENSCKLLFFKNFKLLIQHLEDHEPSGEQFPVLEEFSLRVLSVSISSI